MEPGVHLEALRRESAAVAAAGRRGMSVPVPSCAGWTVGDLVVHLGVIHRRVAKTVRTGAERPTPPEPEWQVDPTGDDLVEWFEAGAAELVSVLEDHGPDAPAGHWFPGGTARVHFRRMAQETAVHRWDAENAHGDPEPIEADLATDGIEEVLDAWLPVIVWRHGPPEGSAPAGERFHLHRTDGEGEWLVTFTPDGVQVSREHAKGDLALRGAASDLLLFLWGRVPADRLEVFGDRALVDRWFDLAHISV